MRKRRKLPRSRVWTAAAVVGLAAVVYLRTAVLKPAQQQQRPDASPTPPPSGRQLRTPPPEPEQRGWQPPFRAPDGRNTTAGVALSASAWLTDLAVPDAPRQSSCAEHCDWRRPDTCWAGGAKPRVLHYRHKTAREGQKQAASDLDPAAFLDRVRQLSAGGGGVALAESNGTALPETVNSVPIASSHGGRHPVRDAWPLKKQGNEHADTWNVSWPARPTHPPGTMPAQPAMWAAVVAPAWARKGNVFGCSQGFTSGACLWDNPHPFKAEVSVPLALAFCDEYASGYFHFVSESLPRLAAVWASLVSKGGYVVAHCGNPAGSKNLFAAQFRAVDHKPAKYVWGYLVDVLGLPRDRVLVKSTVHADVMVYPQPQVCGQTYTHSLLALRRVVFARMRLPHTAPPLPAGGQFVVLLAVRSKGPRMPVNWDDVTARLAAEYGGGSPVVVEAAVSNRSVADQVRSFNRADLVIGPHGSNLANAVWMRHGTSVLEFMSHRYGNMCYYSMSQRLGLRHRFVLHDALKAATVAGEKRRYEIDAEEVLRHVADERSRRVRGDWSAEWAADAWTTDAIT